MHTFNDFTFILHCCFLNHNTYTNYLQMIHVPMQKMLYLGPQSNNLQLQLEFLMSVEFGLHHMQSFDTPCKIILDCNTTSIIIMIIIIYFIINC